MYWFKKHPHAVAHVAIAVAIMLVSHAAWGVRIYWEAPHKFADGNGLIRCSERTPTEVTTNKGCLDAYTIYWATESGAESGEYANKVVIEDESLGRYLFADGVIPSGNVYFARSESDDTGDESELSGELAVTISNKPGSPFVLSAAEQIDAVEVDGTLVIGQTGKPLTFEWFVPHTFDKTVTEPTFYAHRATDSVSMLVTLNDFDAVSGLFSQDQSGQAVPGHFSIWVGTAGAVNVRNQDVAGGQSQTFIRSTKKLTAGTEHRIETVVANGVVTLTIDGEPQGSGPYFPAANSIPLLLGGMCSTCVEREGTKEPIRGTVTLQETFDGGTTEVELIEHGGTVPVARGVFNASSTWEFTPRRAGLFNLRLRRCTPDCEPWTQSDELGFVYYFKLAAPTGGSID